SGTPRLANLAATRNTSATPIRHLCRARNGTSVFSVARSSRDSAGISVRGVLTGVIRVVVAGAVHAPKRLYALLSERTREMGALRPASNRGTGGGSHGGRALARM